MNERQEDEHIARELLGIRPTFPQVIDSSMLSAFRSCPYKAYLGYIEHWKPHFPSVHLIAGGAFAKGIEIARKAFYEQGRNQEDSEALGLLALVENYGSFECPPESAKSLERMCGALEFYLSNYPLGSDGAEPITLPTGRRGIEFSFLEPLDLMHPTSGDPLLFSGRADMVASFAGGVYNFDEKTTTQLGAKWADQWDLRCFDSLHELYTRRGWKPIESITEEMEILQSDEVGNLSFTKPQEIIKKFLDNETLISLEGRRVSQAITKNHRVLLNKRRGGTITVFAESIKKQDNKHSIPLAGCHLEERLPDDIQRFIAAVQADAKLTFSKGQTTSGRGHREHMPNRAIEFGFTKQRKINRLRELLERLEIFDAERKDSRNTFYISGFSELSRLVDLLLDGAKEFKAGQEILFGDAFLDELEFWDGNGKQYYTNSEINARFVATVAALNDRAASVNSDDQGHWTVVLSSDTQRKLDSIRTTEKSYTGYVYCVTVPDGYLITRRNGSISLSGNSQFTSYCWAGRRIGVEMQGTIVRGISILKNKYETAQAITYRAGWELDRWEELMYRELGRMLEMFEEMQYPQDLDGSCVRAGSPWDRNTDSACNDYGGCQFRKVCKAKNPYVVLEQDFARRVWDPVSHKEIPIEEYEAGF